MNPAAPYWTSEDDLPADTGWPEYDQARAERFGLVGKHRKNSAALAKNERDQQQARQDYPDAAARALRAGGKAPSDPMPKLEARQQQLESERDVLIRALRQSAEEIEALVHANRENWRAMDLVLLDDAVAQAQADLDALIASCDRVYRLRVQDNWLVGQKASAATLGSAELNKLIDMLAEAARPRQLLYVDARNFKRLGQGDDAEALDGTPVPAGTPLSAVSLVHTPGLRYGLSPLGKAGDRD